MDLNQLLVGKNVFITGAGANIGRAIALEMAAHKANVYFADLDSARCDAVEKELALLGAKTKSFAFDISRRENIEAICRALSQEKIAIDILVNNVGVYARKVVEGESGDAESWLEWQRVFDTNIVGPIHLTKRLTRAMSERGGGCVLFITSMHQWSVRGDASYSSSKAALGMIVKELAVELAEKNIRVNGIAPGYVEEDEQGAPIPHRHTRLNGTSVPPHYIGRAALYLASEHFSKYTTGSILALDSGLYLGNHLTLDIAPKISLARKVARKIRRTVIGSR